MPIPLKTKAFILKSKVILAISLFSRKEKIEKAPLPKQTKIMLLMLSRTLHCAIKRIKVIHTSHQFENTKYIPYKSLKIPLTPSLCFSLLGTI
jgi:hypothetical protein